MIKVTIDGVETEVEPGTTILNAARQIGGDLVPPAMCYYSKLKGSGGKCRTCLVKVAAGSAKDPRPMPKLVASCSTPVQDGMVVQNITSPEVLEARKGVVEFLLINHPLDCPICDQAGECHLQDLAFEHGSAKTRYEEERRTFDKIDIGSKIQLHMTRCILCYRCVFTANQITNERVHGILNRGDAAEIGTYIENVIENDFSGNVIDVCPVGALTDKTFRFKSRVWFVKPMYAHRNCDKCCGKTTVWMKGDEVFRVTGRKDQYGEVEDFICNDCRFEKKLASDWTVEGPAPIQRNSVQAQNKYLQGIKVDAPKNIGYGNISDR
ncbi:NADH dehydrogenase subunit G [Sporocytophaga myxococcoides]|uniref:NADH dehydrogenase subunit G n=1 Tax=Sporocytophaga myxococcoides TaxID=153721 RepID=A0A098LAN6_9BACT|nr:2Fe-2S iron-sulfur cluster-binding protein [Sporocytophaga myxococcoides]GAL83507.1 NADH dehydrogenase subunit G [Sporocytophaga myxococcoides]